MPQSIFTPTVAQDLKNRINQLSATSQGQWGKMNVAEMLNHCTLQMQVALGEKPMKANIFMRIIGKIVKWTILSDRPTPKNSPTADVLIPTNVKDIETEKRKVIESLEKMIANEANFEGKKHPFFGKMTADEYGKITWNHTDYHLNQFGQ